MCAHFNADMDRRPLFLEQVSSGKLPHGIGIDDGVAVVFQDGARPMAWSAEIGCWAYDVRAGSNGTASLVELPAFV